MFPKDPQAQADAFRKEGQLQFEFGGYSALRPKDNIDLRHLARWVAFAYDYSIGAERFIKGVAKKLGLKDPDKIHKGAAVRAAAAAR